MKKRLKAQQSPSPAAEPISPCQAISIGTTGPAASSSRPGLSVQCRSVASFGGQPPRGRCGGVLCVRRVHRGVRHLFARPVNPNRP